MRGLYRKLKDSDDRGAALMLVGSSLLLLMGMAAFGTDLAWFYLNSARIQRAADAAALGGVVYLPGDPTEAYAAAVRVATQNGYTDSVEAAQVMPERIPDQPTQLKVTISDTVETFFLKALGFDGTTITQTATADYVPPLRLGSPRNQFGNSCDPKVFNNCGPNFWANITGKYMATGMGDAYASWCRDKWDDPPCEGRHANELRRSQGYLYGIESTSEFTLQFVDLVFRNFSGFAPTADDYRTGDGGCDSWGESREPDCGPTMYVALYAPDPTPLKIDTAPVCEAEIPPEAQILDTSPYTWERPDPQGCWTQSGPGIWVVQVRFVDPGPVVDRSGINRYSVRSTTGQLYALRDFAIFNNTADSVTEFYLAEVPNHYAGKKLVIELFDAGESRKPGRLEVVGPDGTVWDDSTCVVSSRKRVDDQWRTVDTKRPGQACSERVHPREYNDAWLQFAIELPPDYTCTACWWKIKYAYSSHVDDTTTWQAYIAGNPIHLVP